MTISFKTRRSQNMYSPAELICDTDGGYEMDMNPQKINLELFVQAYLSIYDISYNAQSSV